MFRWMTMTLCTAMLFGPQSDPQPPSDRPADGPPTTRPADEGGTLRTPAQADILRQLLGRNERPTPIRPLDPGTPGQGDGVAAGVDAEGQPLLLEGTFVVERPGRLVREGGRAKFVFHVEGGTRALRTMELLENQLLEAMEREAEAGFAEFIITAEVTRYRDRNHLLLRKILRRVDHGNLSQ